MADRTKRSAKAVRGAGSNSSKRNGARPVKRRDSGYYEEYGRPERTKKRKKAKKRSGWSVVMRIIVATCCFLLLVVLAAIGVMMSKMSKLETTTLDPDELSISDELEYDETGYLNVALFGLDTRENSDEMGSRSDTIMIASLNRETKDLKLVSVYRDTLLQQEDGSYNKANAAYSFGEAQEAVSLLNRNLDLDIMKYVTVNFSAMVDVIDALGGLDLEVTEEELPYVNAYSVEIIENTGIDSPGVENAGYQHLNGTQATAYARIRYTEGDDYKRTERQRTVLKKMAEKAQEVDLLTINKIIDKVFPKIETNFTMTEILAYAKDVKKYHFGETSGFPYDVTTMDYGDAGNVVVPVGLADNVERLHEYFYGEDGYKPSSTVNDISDEIAYISGTSSGDYSDYGSDTYGYDTGYSDYSDTGGFSNTGGYTDGYTDGAGGTDNGYQDTGGYGTGNDYTNAGQGWTGDSTYGGGDTTW